MREIRSVGFGLSCILLFLSAAPMAAQVANDECSTALLLNNVQNWCSGPGAYTTNGATLSADPRAACFPGSFAGPDIWFAFVAQASDLRISVKGAAGNNPGGTLQYPQLAIYGGSCGALQLRQCISDGLGANFVETTASGLVAGQTYYIRVGARNQLNGSFQLCLNNYNQPPNPLADCPTGQVLCSKDPVTVEFVGGEGFDPFEINNVCGRTGCQPVEEQSHWLKWTAGTSGTLSFSITPLNPSDDIDFVLFELPGGLDDCPNRIPIRCMSSGENVGQPISNWVSCTGATGLRAGEVDPAEYCGCSVGDNNFLAPVDMIAGKSYALVVVNFSRSGRGFRIEFGGTGTFAGAVSGVDPFKVLEADKKALTPFFPFPPVSDTSVVFSYRLVNRSSQPFIVDRITDLLPSPLTYRGIEPGSDITNAKSSVVPANGVSGSLSWVGGPLSAFPPNREYYLPPNDTLELLYKARVPAGTAAGRYTGAARAFIGGCPIPEVSASVNIGVLCPSINGVISGTSGVCAGAGSRGSLSVNELDNMRLSAFGGQNYTIRFVYFNSGNPVNAYGTPSGILGNATLNANGDAASLTNAAYPSTPGNYYVYAILHPAPADPSCRPFAGPFLIRVFNEPLITISGGTSICNGGSATLSALVDGGVGNCVIQWQQLRNNQWENISGGTGPTLTVSPQASTQYRALLTCAGNGCAQAVSNMQTITVLQNQQITLRAPAAVCAGDQALITATVNGGLGGCYILWQLSSNGTTWVNIASTTSTTIGVTPNATYQYRAQLVCSSAGCVVSSNVITIQVIRPIDISLGGGNVTICAGGEANLNATLTGGIGNCTVQWQQSTNSGQSWSTIIGVSGTTLRVTPLVNTQYRAIYDCTANVCKPDTSNVQTVTVLADPRITISGGKTVCAGGSAQLTANVVRGAGTCTIFWQFFNTAANRWEDIQGVTGSRLSVIPLRTTQYRAKYECTATGCDTVFSNVETVTIIPDPSVTISGQSTICLGGIGVLRASLSGGMGNCSVQWQWINPLSGNWENLTGQTRDSLVINGLDVSTSFRAIYTCNGEGCNQAISAPFPVQLLNQRQVTISGTTRICPGGTATLSATGANNVCTLRWRFYDRNLQTWVNIPNATGPTLQVRPSETTDYSLFYSCGSGACDSGVSNTVRVNVVNSPTAVVSGPPSICAGQSALLSVALTNTDNSCSLIWESSPNGNTWTVVPNASGSTLNAAPTASTYYRAIYTCAGGCAATSNSFLLNVLPGASVNISGNTAICTGGSTILTAAAQGGAGTCSLQWQSSANGSTWTNISNAQNNSLTVSPASNTYYRVLYSCTGPSCPANPSNILLVQVFQDPSISIAGGGVICTGGTLTLNAFIGGGAGNCSIQWQSSVNGGLWTNIANANSASINVNPAQTTQYRATYTCSAGGCESQISNTVTVTVVSDPAISISGPSRLCTGASGVLNCVPSGGTGNCIITWSTSPDSINWTPIPQANGLSLNIAPAVTTYYRATLQCSGLDCGTAHSNVLKVTVAPGAEGKNDSKQIASCASVNYDLQQNVNQLGNGQAGSFTWVAVSNPNISGASLTPKTGPVINDVLTNLSASPQTVVYQVSAGSGSQCPGGQFTISVTVLPRQQLGCVACITQLNVLLDAECKAVITPDMVVRINQEACPNAQDILNALEVVVDDGNTNNILEGCGTFRFIVRLKPGFENCYSFQPCQGTVVGQDLQGPRLTQRTGVCGRPIAPTAIWVDTLLCTDVLSVFNNTMSWTNPAYPFYTGTAVFEDACRVNCNCSVSVKITDQVDFYACNTVRNDNIWAKLTRTFTATDCRGNTTLEVQNVFFKRPPIDRDFYSRQGIQEVVIHDSICQAPSTVAMIKAFKERYYIFDHPYDCGPNQTRYSYFPEAVAAGNAQTTLSCSYSFDVETISEFPLCSGGKTVLIAVKAFDGCTGMTIPLDTFRLRAFDGKSPIISTAFRNVVISTGPENCEASFGIDISGLSTFFGIRVTDNCTANPIVSVVVWYFGPEYVQGFPIGPDMWRVANYPRMIVKGLDGKDYLTVTGARTGRHKLVIEAFDECLNRSTREFEFTIQDQIAPVMKCADRLTVSLTDGQGYQNGYAKVSVENLNRGTFDNCGLKWIRVRRPFNPTCLSQFIAAGYDSNGDGQITVLDGIDWNKDGDINDFGEKFSLDAATGLLMTPMLDFAEFFCCDIGTVPVQLWAEDQAGNRNFCTTQVTIDDKLEPRWALPAPASVRCDQLDLIDALTKRSSYLKNSPEYNLIVAALGNDLLITGGSACSELDIRLNIDDQLHCNAGYADLSWTIIKGTGNQAIIRTTGKVRLTVVALHEYNILFPADIDVRQCGAMPKSEIILDELGCDALSVLVEDKPYARSVANPDCYTVFRTYTVVNWCQYDESCSDPALWAVVVPRDPGGDGPDGVNVLVRDRAPFDGTEEIYFEENNNRIAEPGERVFSFTYNNTSNQSCPSAVNKQFAWMFTQLIRVSDNEPPVVQAPRQAVFPMDPATCLGKVDLRFAAEDNCAGIIGLNAQLDAQGNVEMDVLSILPDPQRYILPEQSLQNFVPGAKVEFLGNNQWSVQGNFPEGAHTLYIRVKDGCGNISQPYAVELRIEDQIVSPPICKESLSVDLMPIDTNGDGRTDRGALLVLATSFIASPVFDCNGQGAPNASGQKEILKYSINREGQTPNPGDVSLPLTCDDAGTFVAVEVHTWDERGNRGTCQTYLFVTDNQLACVPKAGFIEGQIATEEKNMVEGVEVQLSGGARLVMMTRRDGMFYFDGIDPGYDYSVFPIKNNDFSNGVSTLDLVQIQEHILGIKLLNSPYKLIAADVNNSRSITTLDLVQLRRLILNMEPDFPNNRSWRFIDAKHVFTDPQNPWLRPFPEVINFNDLPDTVRNANFIGVKIGDVSGNAVANSSMIRSRNIREGFDLVTQATTLKPGQVYRVPLRAPQWQGSLGAQFSLEFDRQALQLLDVEGGLVPEEHLGVFPEDGVITLSWVKQQSAVKSDDRMLTLVFQALDTRSLEQVLRISSRPTAAEAYDLAGNLSLPRLRFENSALAALPAMAELYQNVPNPFSESTAISFWLPSAQEAELIVYDMKGRALYRNAAYFDGGLHEINIRKSALNSSGMLFYTLKTEGFTATRKMLLLE